MNFNGPLSPYILITGPVVGYHPSDGTDYYIIENISQSADVYAKAIPCLILEGDDRYVPGTSDIDVKISRTINEEIISIGEIISSPQVHLNTSIDLEASPSLITSTLLESHIIPTDIQATSDITISLSEESYIVENIVSEGANEQSFYLETTVSIEAEGSLLAPPLPSLLALADITTSVDIYLSLLVGAIVKPDITAPATVDIDYIYLNASFDLDTNSDIELSTYLEVTFELGGSGEITTNPVPGIWTDYIEITTSSDIDVTSVTGQILQENIESQSYLDVIDITWAQSLEITNSGTLDLTPSLAIDVTKSFERAYYWDLNTDPGWTTEGLWQYGTPNGAANDPMSGYTGSNVYGYNISGYYEQFLTAKHLKTQAIDCSRLTGTILKFRKWLNINTGDYASASVSNDGINWTTVWSNNGAYAYNYTWDLVSVDISSIADGESEVYVRWTMGPTGFFRWGGLNIDDIEIWGNTLVDNKSEITSSIIVANYSEQIEINAVASVNDPGIIYGSILESSITTSSSINDFEYTARGQVQENIECLTNIDFVCDLHTSVSIDADSLTYINPLPSVITGSIEINCSTDLSSEFIIGDIIIAPITTSSSFDINIIEVNYLRDTYTSDGAQHEWSMSSNPGWTLDTGWAYGTPLGAGGDPTSGYTGSNVVGYNLSGQYQNSMPARNATTNAVDCTGITNTRLKFRRWLGIESSSYDKAYVQISTNGTSWTNIWSHTGGTFQDNSWVLQDLNISSIADNKPIVYFRWVIGPTDGSVTYSGWNIDDVQVTGLKVVDNPVNCDGSANIEISPSISFSETIDNEASIYANPIPALILDANIEITITPDITAVVASTIISQIVADGYIDTSFCLNPNISIDASCDVSTYLSRAVSIDIDGITDITANPIIATYTDCIIDGYASVLSNIEPANLLSVDIFADGYFDFSYATSHVLYSLCSSYVNIDPYICTKLSEVINGYSELSTSPIIAIVSDITSYGSSYSNITNSIIGLVDNVYFKGFTYLQGINENLAKTASKITIAESSVKANQTTTGFINLFSNTVKAIPSIYGSSSYIINRASNDLSAYQITTLPAYYYTKANNSWTELDVTFDSSLYSKTSNNQSIKDTTFDGYIINNSIVLSLKDKSILSDLKQNIQQILAVNDASTPSTRKRSASTRRGIPSSDIIVSVTSVNNPEDGTVESAIFDRSSDNQIHFILECHFELGNAIANTIILETDEERQIKRSIINPGLIPGVYS